MVFSARWFAQQQGRLLWLLNTPLIRLWFRWVLCIHEQRLIVAIAPNSVTVHDGGLTFTTDFRTHAKYAKRLFYAFHPLWYACHVWDVIADPLVPSLSFGFSTLTAYSDPGDPGSVSGDALVFRGSVDETWATLRAGAGTSYDATATSSFLVGFRGSTTSSQWKLLQRALFHFDTSALTAGATISAATLSIYGNDKQDQLSATPDITLYQSTVSSNTTFANADFQSFGTTAFATAITYASWSTTGYNDLALNANGLSNISKTAVSKFGAKNANHDVANSAPTWGSDQYAYLGSYYADQTGTTNDPKLVVTYTVSGSSVPVLAASQFGRRRRQR